MIVAFSGFIGAGKDTAAQQLIEVHGFSRMAFGALLKDAVALLFGLDREMLEGATPEARAARDQRLPYWDSVLDLDQEVTPRFLLQYFAEECVRKSLHRDFWSLALEVQIAKALASSRDVVITDLRHINEWRMLQRHDAKCIGVYKTLPWWVAPFYEHMESVLPDGSAEIRQYSAGELSVVVAHAMKFFAFPLKGMDKVIHVSEWQHLLIPFDHVFHNNRSKTALWLQVDSAVYPQPK